LGAAAFVRIMKSIPVVGVFQFGASAGFSGIPVLSVKVISAGLYAAVLLRMSAWPNCGSGCVSPIASFRVTVATTGAPPAGVASVATASRDETAQAMRRRRGRVIRPPERYEPDGDCFDTPPAAPPGARCD
jgi:hypothetical protein